MRRLNPLVKANEAQLSKNRMSKKTLLRKELEKAKKRKKRLLIQLRLKRKKKRL
jgi:hypothetical protein